MKVGESVEDFIENFCCCVATIGNFDGLHLGHRQILSRVKKRAAKKNCPTLAITFEPHPSSVLYPTRGLSRLTSPRKKLELIDECGIDGVLALPFTLSFAGKGPRAFAEEILHPLKVQELYVGHDFFFGAGRSGNVEALAKEGKLMGFDVYRIKEVTVNNEPVRSTRIRELISKGQVEKAAALLARYHSVSGKVVEGAARGRSLGFPTANLGEPLETVPGAGIYATRTRWKDKLYDSATHVGVIPTFDVDVPGIETYIFGFDGEITGDEIEIFFIKKIRDSKRFDSPEKLKEQIGRDCEETQRILKGKGIRAYLPRRYIKMYR